MRRQRPQRGSGTQGPATIRKTHVVASMFTPRTVWNLGSHRSASHRIASHHITSHHITSYLIASHRIASDRIASHHITSHHITSHHIIFAGAFGWLVSTYLAVQLSLVMSHTCGKLPQLCNRGVVECLQGTTVFWRKRHAPKQMTGTYQPSTKSCCRLRLLGSDEPALLVISARAVMVPSQESLLYFRLIAWTSRTVTLLRWCADGASLDNRFTSRPRVIDSGWIYQQELRPSVGLALLGALAKLVHDCHVPALRQTSKPGCLLAEPESLPLRYSAQSDPSLLKQFFLLSATGSLGLRQGRVKSRLPRSLASTVHRDRHDWRRRCGQDRNFFLMPAGSRKSNGDVV